METKGKILIDRLRRRLDVVGLSAHQASKLASPTGSGDLIRDLERSKSKAVRLATLLALADVLECDSEYLTGEQAEARRHRDPAEAAAGMAAASFSLTPQEVELIGLFRAAPDEQERLLTIARGLVQASTAIDTRGRARIKPS